MAYACDSRYVLRLLIPVTLWEKRNGKPWAGGAPIVKARNEIDAVPLEDFVDHVNEYGSMSESAYGHLAWYSI